MYLQPNKKKTMLDVTIWGGDRFTSGKKSEIFRNAHRENHRTFVIESTRRLVRNDGAAADHGESATAWRWRRLILYFRVAPSGDVYPRVRSTDSRQVPDTRARLRRVWPRRVCAQVYHIILYKTDPIVFGVMQSSVYYIVINIIIL